MADIMLERINNFRLYCFW